MKLKAPNALFLLLLLIACQPNSPTETAQDLPPGQNNQDEVAAIYLNFISPNTLVCRG